MVTYYFRTIKDEVLKELKEPRSGVWVHVQSPTDEEIKRLIETFGLDENLLEDARDFFEVPRFERSGNATYFFTRYPFDEKDEDIDTAPLMIAIGESFVVTVALREVPFLEPFLSGKREIYTTQKSKMFLEFMTALAEAYDRELVHMRKAVYRDRTQVRDIRGRDIQRLVLFEHELNDTISALVPTNNWIHQLTKGNYLQLYNEDVDLLEDLVIDNEQLIDSAKAILKTIQNIRGASEAILTNNLNNTIKLLTALTIILTIPTIASSMYGMNVPLPLSGHPHAFWLIIVIILMVVSVLVWFFKRNDWM